MELIEEIYNELNNCCDGKNYLNFNRAVCILDPIHYVEILKTLELQHSYHHNLYHNPGLGSHSYYIQHPLLGPVMLLESDVLSKIKVKFKIIILSPGDIICSKNNLIPIIKQKLNDSLVNEMLDNELEEVLSK